MGLLVGRAGQVVGAGADRAQQLPQRVGGGQWRPVGVVAVQVEVELAVGEEAARRVRRLGRQRGLADAGWPVQHPDAQWRLVAGGPALQFDVQLAQFGLAADEPGGGVRQLGRDHPGPGGFLDTAGVVVAAQDALVRLTQSRAGVDAELTAEPRADRRVRRERFRCASGRVQGQHQMLAEALPEGVLVDEPAKVADETGGFTECESGFGQLLVGAQP